MWRPIHPNTEPQAAHAYPLWWERFFYYITSRLHNVTGLGFIGWYKSWHPSDVMWYFYINTLLYQSSCENMICPAPLLQVLSHSSATAAGKSSRGLTPWRCTGWSTKVNAVSGARSVAPLSLPSVNISTTWGCLATSSASLGFTSAKRAGPCLPTPAI